MKKNCYEIIKDEAALLEFIDWLPELQDNEQYYLSLFARKKYCSDLIRSNDKTQLRRFTSSKERMLDKIKQLEIPIGTWKLGEQSAPQKSLVLYIMPNPRDMIKATKMMGKHCWDLDRSKNFNLVAEAMSCVQQSKSRNCFVDFDIDTKDVDLGVLDWFISPESYTVLETRGGYHILIDPAKAAEKAKSDPMSFSKNWYQEMIDAFNIDQIGDMMIPVPGCVQSDFIPKFI